MSPFERIPDTALELCMIPSVTGEEQAIADHVENRLKRTVCEVHRVGNSLVARSPGGTGALTLLVGHLDTVPAKPGDGTPQLDGDLLYGLGASDMKGGIAVMLALAEALPRTDLDIGFVFYDREEGPWAESGLGPVLERLPWLKHALLAFCLEPSDNVVQVGCVGSLHAAVRFAGKAAHSARPWQGLNAIHAAAPLLSRIAARAPTDVDCGGFVFREVVSATLASGGRGRNVVPDHFELNLNFRFAPSRSVAEAEQELRELVADEAEVVFTDRAPSGRVVTDNKLLRRFLKRTKADICAKQAWTDVARLTSVGIDAVNFGPGLSAQAHQSSEYASVPLLQACYRHFEAFLRA